MTRNQNYYTQTLIVQCMKLKLKMSIKILVIIQLSQNTMMIQKN